MFYYFSSRLSYVSLLDSIIKNVSFKSNPRVSLFISLPSHSNIFNLDKSLTLPLNTNQIVSNNNEIPSQSFSSQHKPGCPKYLPSSEYNLLTSDLFTHTTIDNIKKMYICIYILSSNLVFVLEFFRIFLNQLISSMIKLIYIFISHRKLRIYQLKNFIEKETFFFLLFPRLNERHK